MAAQAISSDSKKFLDHVKKGKARYFALSMTGPKINAIVVQKKPIRDAEVLALRKSSGGKQAHLGVVDGKGTDLRFNLCADDGYEKGPGKDVTLREFLVAAGIKCKPSFVIVAELPVVDDAADVEVTASAPVETSVDVSEITASLKRLTPKIKEFAVSRPDRKLEILAPTKLVKDFLQDPQGDAQDVLDAILKIEALVKELDASSSAPSSRQETDAASAAVAPAWQAARQNWQAAIESLNGQLSELQSVLMKSGDEELADIAEFGLNGVTHDTQVPVVAAIHEISSALSASRSPAASQIGDAITRVAEFRKHIDTDPRVAACDDNPFGVEISIRKTLGPVLEDLDAVLQQLA